MTNEEILHDAVAAHCTKDLQKILEQIKAMEAAPIIGSEEYKADQKQWQIRTDRADDLLHQAIMIALITVPSEIKALYDEIDDQHSRVWRIGKYRVTASEVTVDSTGKE